MQSPAAASCWPDGATRRWRCADRKRSVHDFGTRTLIPGFNDTHAHSDSLGLKTIRPSLEGARSIADVLERIRKLVAEKKPGEWVVTMPIGDPPYYWEADKVPCRAPPAEPA